MAPLFKAFPKVFSDRNVKPLCLGMFYLLLEKVDAGELEMTHQEVRAALAGWTRRPSYLRCLIEGADRYDLNGEPLGKVTAEHAKTAKEILEKRKLAQQLKNESKRMVAQMTADLPRHK